MVFSVVTGRVIRGNADREIEMPLLVSPEGPFLPLVQYFLTKPRSLSWQEKVARAVRLFFEYLLVYPSPKQLQWKIFRDFSSALFDGTINQGSGEDSLGLYWHKILIRQAKYSIRILSDFFDWLNEEEVSKSLAFNPVSEGGSFERRMAQYAYAYRSSKAFLGHTWSRTPRESKIRLIDGEFIPKVFPSVPPSFPESHFEELLFRGFKVGGKLDYRGMLITILMFGGGIRASEAFHIYIDDIQPHWKNSESAFVAIHHPSLGIAPNSWRNKSNKLGNRREYLSSEFGLLPRNEVRGSMGAGWKNPALDEKWYLHVHWFPQKYGELFLDLWKFYIQQISSIQRNHPYAWINIGREPIGGIYQINQYHKALQSAVERIGLTFGKIYGTTAHGHRHAYAQRARKGGVNSIILQRIMHHSSPDSQLIYMFVCWPD